jgi:uncharacterized SAM-binding protein YcdF (DUF218 family)
MLSTLLFAAALVFALVAAALNDRAARWRHPLRALMHLLAPVAAAGAVASAPNISIIEKLLTALIVPAGALWAATFALTWWLFLRQRRRQAAVALAAFAAFTLAGNVWIGQATIAWLEDGYRPAPPDARFDAVVVLGGGSDITPWGSPQLGNAGDRLRVAAELFTSGRTRLLVSCGSSIPELSQREVRDLASETAALWEQMGVPRVAIMQLPGPVNTSEEIAEIGVLVRDRGWQRVGLVSSGSHLRRAMRLAEESGLRVTPIAADVRGQLQPASIVGIVPSGPGFYGVQVAFKELAAGLVGR